MINVKNNSIVRTKPTCNAFPVITLEHAPPHRGHNGNPLFCRCRRLFQINQSVWNSIICFNRFAVFIAICVQPIVRLADEMLEANRLTLCYLDERIVNRKKQSIGANEF